MQNRLLHKNPNAIKESVGIKIFIVTNYILLTLLILICLFPFVHLLAISFSSDKYASAGLVGLWPKGFTFDAYIMLMGKKEFFRAFGISVARTIAGTLLTLIVVVLTAYPLSKDDGRVKGRTFL